MKQTKRVISWLLALAMLLSALPMGVFAAEVTPLKYGRNILAQMNNAEALLYAYDVIEEASFGTPNSISLTHATHKVTWEELCTVYDLVLNDHPEIFWHGTSYSGTLRGDGTASSLKPTYTMTGSTLTNAKAALEAEVVRLTADLAGKSDYDKSLLLHDRIAAKTVYKMEGEHQSAYGALIQGTAVCAGYTRAYQLLMQRAGIPTWYVTGTSISPSGQVVRHAWNLVQLDGDWYYTDVTWDDQTNYTFYAYLNNTTAQFTEDHTFGNYKEYLPTATATANNYFVRNNLQRQVLDVKDVANIIKNNSPARVYVTGDKAAFIEAYGFYLWDICEALNSPAGTISYGQASLGREVILRLNITHTCRYATQTVPATCGSNGYTVEICSYDFCHNERNRQVIPATGAHTYDHGCDATCNTCSYTRAPRDHVYSHACDSTCNVCGAVREAGEHVYDNACDPTCRECGAIRPVAPHPYVEEVINPATCGAEGLSGYTCPHCGDFYTESIPATGDHTYDNVCDSECNECYAVRPVEGHVYDTDCDDVCKRCGEYRPVPDHVYDHLCDADCNVCGAVREVGEHVYDNECDPACRECGAIRPVAPHPYVEEVITSATCGAEGLRGYTCPYCGDFYTESIPATGDHTYDNICDAECNGCDNTRPVEGHDYDNACDAECNICYAVREITHTYNHNELVCDVCGATRAIESVGVTTHPSKTNYTLGRDELDLHGGVLTVYYSDGTRSQVDLTDTTVSGFDNTIVGACNLTVSYGSYTTVFTVQIVDLNNRIPGDLNWDGKVNVRDLGLLQQHLNGWDVGIILEAADVTADGKVNVRDLGMLQQYLNGWDVELK